jgi:hypothetical protein
LKSSPVGGTHFRKPSGGLNSKPLPYGGSRGASRSQEKSNSAKRPVIKKSLQTSPYLIIGGQGYYKSGNKKWAN